MASTTSPLPLITRREFGDLTNLKTELFNKRLNIAKNLYRRDLVCHYGCVNAIEFSFNGELLASVNDINMDPTRSQPTARITFRYSKTKCIPAAAGGDDRRVMLWQFGQQVMDYGKPEAMNSLHQSNVFCLGITSDNQRIFSGGNDDIVIVHDTESKRPVEVLKHQRAVVGLSIDPFNELVVATAGNDGRLLLFDTRQSVHESLVISRSRKAFHGVMFHPLQVGMLVSANARDGVALWDLRSPKMPVIRYTNSAGSSTQNSMSVRFNATGSHLLALRRRMSPVLYAVHAPPPAAEFYHQDYYNSCTMKSCCFAGEGDKYVLSGSDDFNLYLWKVPDGVEPGSDTLVEPPHIVLYGHRSIANQVRYNPHYCVIASSGVEKIIKIWSAMEYPGMRGDLTSGAPGSDNPRELYSHEDYVTLVHHSGQYISHNYTDQSTSEDPRMMAFFDSLVQRSLECVGGSSDSLDESSSATPPPAPVSDSTDTEHRPTDSTKLGHTNGSRSQRCPNRLARHVSIRCPKGTRHQKRGLASGSRRSKPGRRSTGKPTRTTCRIACHVRPQSAPSSERTDTPELTASRPLRRRINLTRSYKRKSKTVNYRKNTTRSNGGTSRKRDISNSNFSSFNNQEENLAMPSTSSGYRGQSTSALFRILEADSDDDQSTSSRPISPRPLNGSQPIPNNLISIVPTPINGSRDTLADSLRNDLTESASSSPLPETRNRIINLRRPRRNGRPISLRSDSSESPSPKPKQEEPSTSLLNRLSPKLGYNRTVARLMNETNESEIESSCSTESSSLWAIGAKTPDSGVGTIMGSSSRNQQAPTGDVSDDPEYQAVKLRQRVKKARRNYRNHIDSDSN